MCAAGNGPRHPGLCRYAYAGQPALHIKGSLLEVWAARPPMCHHRLPMRGTRDGDGEHHPCSAEPRAKSQGIGHTGLLQPMPSLSALLHGEAENLIGHYNLFIGPPLLFDLVIVVKKFIQCEEEHLQHIAILHHILMM